VTGEVLTVEQADAMVLYQDTDGRTALHWCCTVPQSPEAMTLARRLMNLHPLLVLVTTDSKAGLDDQGNPVLRAGSFRLACHSTSTCTRRTVCHYST
jgi:hypothetical protein